MAYFEQLAAALHELTHEERQASIEFYQEFANDAGLSTDSELTTKFGRPKQLARKILADYSVTQVNAPQEDGTHSSWHNVWMIVLGLLSLPVGLPLGGAIILLILALLVIIGLVILMIEMFLWLIGILGGVLFIAGLSVIAQDVGVTLFYVGSGLALIGLFILLWKVIQGTIIWLARWSGQKLGSLYQRIKPSEQTN